MSFEPAPGIYGGAKSLEAYLRYAGVETLRELEEEQLTLDLGAVFTSSSTRTAKSRRTNCSHRQPSGEETRRVWSAMMIAPTLEVCDALLRGETVPIERLDPDWVRRFGIKS
ncbi:MAG: hypothetical protein ABW114_13715 [Gaiellaceae bacterium]